MSNILKYQNPSSPLLIQRVNQSNANFVKRLLDPDRKSIPDWETKGQKIATHKMSWGEDDQGAYVFPEVQEIDGQLIDFSRPPYAPGIADYMAHKNNNIIRMSPEEADWFTRNYKQYYPSFKKGGGIHIKKKNRGKFTDYCGGKVTEECIAKGKKSKDPKIRKRATFAANARKWKHAAGGPLGKPNFKESKEAYYYDPETDTVFAPDSSGEFYHHEMFHARPNLQLLESLKPYYHNLNDDVLKQMGADLSFVKRFNNDPGHFYSPEELGARVTSAAEMLNRMGIKDVTLDFLKNARLNENAYGENFRDLLYMYNDENLMEIFNIIKKHKNGGTLKMQNGTPKYGLPGTSFIVPQPFSPIDIAIKTAQAQAKPIIPGVKEVIGPDGQKIAIRTEQPLIPLEQSIAEWLPGTGDIAEIGYIADDVKNGNYGSAALAAGLVVVPGGIGTAVHKARQLPPLDKIRDNRLRELVEYVQNFGVEKLPFETYLELDDALRYADIGLKGNRKRVQNIVKRVTDDIEKYYDDFRAARANARSTKPTPIKDDWKEPFDEMRPMKSFGHRAKTTHKRGGMLQALDYANHITKKPAY